MTARVAIDPYRPAPHGRYDDGTVVVERDGSALTATGDGHRLAIRHGYATVDDDVAERLAAALAPLTDDHDLFGRAFTGVVLTTHPDPLDAWEAFYRASLARDGGYAEIHRHAAELLPHTEVLDLGASFGLFALQLAARGARVTAADTDANALTLLTRVAQRLRRSVATVVCDAGSPVPMVDGSVDAVAVLHVLEHLDEHAGAHLLADAVRLARHRVVVAVPYEPTHTALYGHVRVLDPEALADVAVPHAVDWRASVHEHHGGWLVLDRR